MMFILRASGAGSGADETIDASGAGVAAGCVRELWGFEAEKRENDTPASKKPAAKTAADEAYSHDRGYFLSNIEGSSLLCLC